MFAVTLFMTARQVATHVGLPDVRVHLIGSHPKSIRPEGNRESTRGGGIGESPSPLSHCPPHGKESE